MGIVSNALLKSDIIYVCSQSFAFYHALLRLVGFHKSGRCKIHAAIGIRSYCFPDG